MAMIAAIKNVLSAISDTRMDMKEGTNEGKKLCSIPGSFSDSMPVSISGTGAKALNLKHFNSWVR